MTEPATVRKTIHDVVDRNPNATYEAVVNDVQDELDVPPNTITEEMDKMERAEFLYLNEKGDTTRVKVA